MTAEEIKRILKNTRRTIQFSPSRRYVELFNKEDIQNLLDYITNLQQELQKANDTLDTHNELIEKLQEDLDKANGIIKKDRQFYKCRMDEYVELKKENEKLKECYCNRTDCGGRIKDSKKYDSVYQEKEDYKSRCEKTIEYINFVINHYKEQLETPIEDTYFDSDVNRKGYILSIIAYLQTILDTLIGSDENE
ncbi:MAG: hypothetical protein ACI4VE_05695 [Clostridia bacterium]